MKIIIEGTTEEIFQFYEKALRCEGTQEVLREYMAKRKAMLAQITSESEDHLASCTRS